MITISQFKELCNKLKQEVPEITDVSIVVDIAQATKKLGTRPGIRLLGVIPSAARTGASGAQYDVNAMIFMILEKGRDGDDELLQYERLQPMILKLRDYIEEKNADGVPFYKGYRPSGTSIDPENFSGFNGWSLAVEF